MNCQNWLELGGTITGFLCVWFAAKKNVLTWPLGIASVIFYFVVFNNQKLYSDALLQIFFALFQVYGWYLWSANKGDNERTIKSLKPAQWVLVTVLLGTVTGLWFYLLITLKPDASLPFWDSFTTVGSLMAVYLQARKNIACWWLWIVVDLVYVPMYIYKFLVVTALLYAGFLFLAVYGLWNWNKLKSMQEPDQLNLKHDA